MDMPLAGHSNSYHGYPLDAALSGVAAAGFRYVELSAVVGWTEHVPIDADARHIGEITAKLSHVGLRPSALSGHSDLTTPEGLAVGRQAADLCVALGVPILNTAIGGHDGGREDFDAFMRHIGQLADYCQERQLTIGLEVHGEVMASGRLSLPILEAIDRDNVRLNYDTANCEFYGGARAVDDLRATVPRLCHLHLKDKIGGRGEWNFPPLGQGHVDFARLLAILAEEGYRGPASVEIEFEGEPWPPLAQVDRAMKVSFAHLSHLGLS